MSNGVNRPTDWRFSARTLQDTLQVERETISVRYPCISIQKVNEQFGKENCSAWNWQPSWNWFEPYRYKVKYITKYILVRLQMTTCIIAVLMLCNIGMLGQMRCSRFHLQFPAADDSLKNNLFWHFHPFQACSNRFLQSCHHMNEKYVRREQIFSHTRKHLPR